MRTLLADRRDVSFDPIDPNAVIWHHNIPQREQHDPSFRLNGRKVISCFRRLPHWILSRVIFEAERSARIVTLEMILRGQFFEADGSINSADDYVKLFAEPGVDHWLRTERLSEDLAAIFNFDREHVESTLAHKNKSRGSQIKDLSFWFARAELAGLYSANPVWSAVERKVYGSTVIDLALWEKPTDRASPQPALQL